MTNLQLYGELKTSLQDKAGTSGLTFQPVALESEQIIKVRSSDPDPTWLEIREETGGRSLTFSFGGYRDRERIFEHGKGGQLTYEPERRAFRLSYDHSEEERFFAPSQVADILIVPLLKT